jgi:hypothetical protein
MSQDDGLRLILNCGGLVWFGLIFHLVWFGLVWFGKVNWWVRLVWAACTVAWWIGVGFGLIFRPLIG